MLVPVLADHLCAVQAGEIHAVPRKDVLRALAGGRRKTLDTVCGLHRAGLFVIPADMRGDCVLPWPCPHRYDQRARCLDCWVATGSKRSADMFRELRRRTAA